MKDHNNTMQAPKYEKPSSCMQCRRQSWLGWGVSSVAGYLGYVPSQDAPRDLSPLSESDIQELYHDLGFDPQTQVDTRNASRAMGINFQLNVSCLSSQRSSTRYISLICINEASCNMHASDWAPHYVEPCRSMQPFCSF